MKNDRSDGHQLNRHWERIKKNPRREEGGRLETLDLVRGLTLVSMIFYHWMWDFIYLSETGGRMAGLKEWYSGSGGFFWQQTICWTFILLSGFCVPFSRRILRRGLEVTAAGIAVTAVTVLGMYEERVLCGVLSFLGAAMLVTGVLNRLFSGKMKMPESAIKKSAVDRPGLVFSLAGLAVSCLFFYVTRWVNLGFLQAWPGRRIGISALLNAEGIPGFLLTALGFPMKDFYSTDYFSLLPWIFLFWAGFWLNRCLAAKGWFSRPLFHWRLPVLNWMGRNSLLLYLIHQPVLYLTILILF